MAPGSDLKNRLQAPPKTRRFGPTYLAALKVRFLADRQRRQLAHTLGGITFIIVEAVRASFQRTLEGQVGIGADTDCVLASDNDRGR